MLRNLWLNTAGKGRACNNESNMNMKKPRRSKSRGSALPLAVLAVMTLFAMGIAPLGLGLNSRLYSVRTVSEITVRCAADSGLAMALFEMNKNLQANIKNTHFGSD